MNKYIIFEEADGWHYSDRALPYLDARGKAYPTRRAAQRAAKQRAEGNKAEGRTNEDVWLGIKRLVKTEGRAQ